MREPLPLATIHDAVLDFLRGRDDAVLYGAQAVNAYVDESRMTQDVDILSIRAAELAEEIRSFLHERFQIAVRIRSVAGELGHRIYQVRKPKNRHLVDVRSISVMPAVQRVDQVLVLAPADLIASKIVSAVSRPKSAKGLIDQADLRRLLLAFPDLKTDFGPVRERLEATISAGADARVLDTWRELVAQEILPEDDEGKFRDQTGL